MTRTLGHHADWRPRCGRSHLIIGQVPQCAAEARSEIIDNWRGCNETQN